MLKRKHERYGTRNSVICLLKISCYKYINAIALKNSKKIDLGQRLAS